MVEARLSMTGRPYLAACSGPVDFPIVVCSGELLGISWILFIGYLLPILSEVLDTGVQL